MLKGDNEHGCNFNFYFQIPISYWLYNEYNGTLNDDFNDFAPLIGEAETSYSTLLNTPNNTGNAITLLLVISKYITVNKKDM